MTKNREVTKIKIEVAPIKNYEKLKQSGYLCFNVVGGMIDANNAISVPRLNASRHRNAYNGKDYFSASLGYSSMLSENRGAIIRYILDKINAEKTTKVAFLGIDKDGYCFRYLFTQFFMSRLNLYQNDVRVSEVNFTGIDYSEFIKIAYSDDYWQQPSRELSDEWVRGILEGESWTFAKTMPENPHSYTLRRNWDSFDDYLEVASHIRKFGKIESFYGTIYRVLHLGGYKYWTCASDVKNTDVDLINRAKI